MFWATPLGLLLLSSHSLSTCAAEELTSVIQTEEGPVQGEILTTWLEGKKYASFKGIPFAEPPVGNLRFQPPKKKKPWTSVLKATKEGHQCVQLDNPVNGSYPGNEDCLNLNIYTPQTKFEVPPEELHPILVFIYGGAFTTGYKDASSFGPDFLMDFEKVCVVLGNYRLGVFGFGTLDDPRMMGNQGIKDQYMVLEWVKRNAKHFHCDSNKITLAGQSAGSASVFVHLIAEKAGDIIQNAISLSGTSLCPWGSYSPQGGTLQTLALVAKMGYPTLSKDQAFETLMKADVYDIMAAMQKLPLSNLTFKPTVERKEWNDTYLTKCALKKTAEGEYLKIPFMFGFTDSEAVKFASSAIDVITWANNTLSGAQCNKEFPLSSYPSIETIIQDAIKYGVSTITEKSVNLLTKFVTDIGFKAPIDLTQRLMSQNSRQLYYYKYSYFSNYSAHLQEGTPLPGAGHGDDIGVIFLRGGYVYPKNPNAPENMFRKNLICLIINFILTGKPTPEGSTCFNSVQWEDSWKTGRQLQIATVTKMVPRQIDSGILALEKPLADSSWVYTGCAVSGR